MSFLENEEEATAILRKKIKLRTLFENALKLKVQTNVSADFCASSSF